jgi:hypothetical protein
MFASSKGKEKKFEIFEKMEKAGLGISLITRCLMYLTWLLYKQLVIQLEISGEGTFAPERTRQEPDGPICIFSLDRRFAAHVNAVRRC